MNYRASNPRSLASLPGFSVDHAGGLGNPVGAGRPQGWRRGPPSPDHEPGDRPQRGRRAGGWPAGEVPGPGDQGREQAGSVAASLRRGRAGQGPAQAAQCGIPQRERGGRSLRHQADPHAPGLGDRLSDRGAQARHDAQCAHHHGRERRNRFLPARIGRGQPEEEAVRVDFSWPARRAGPDGCLCRGGPWPRCRHAQGDHRAGDIMPGPLRGVRHLQFPAPDGSTPQGCAARPWAADRGR